MHRNYRQGGENNRRNNGNYRPSVEDRDDRPRRNFRREIRPVSIDTRSRVSAGFATNQLPASVFNYYVCVKQLGDISTVIYYNDPDDGTPMLEVERDDRVDTWKALGDPFHATEKLPRQINRIYKQMGRSKFISEIVYYEGQELVQTVEVRFGDKTEIWEWRKRDDSPPPPAPERFAWQMSGTEQEDGEAVAVEIGGQLPIDNISCPHCGADAAFVVRESWEIVSTDKPTNEIEEQAEDDPDESDEPAKRR